MNTLQQRIDEALFSKNGIDTQSAAKAAEKEMIKNYIFPDEDLVYPDTNDTEEAWQDIDIEIKGDKLELHMKVNPAYQVPSYQCVIDGLPANFPYRISKITVDYPGSGNCYLFILIQNCQIKELSDIFTPDFEAVIEKNNRKVTGGIQLYISHNPQLSSLKGCPQEHVVELVIDSNPKLMSIDGIPSSIDNKSDSIYFTIKPDETIKQISLGPKDENIHVQTLYNALDKNCKLARSIKAVMKMKFGIRL